MTITETQAPPADERLFQIRSRWDGRVLFELRRDSLRLCVEAAVKGGADLRGADLGGAYLGGAYLGGAYLGGADLRGAYLGGADLGGAYLRGADLGGARLVGARLVGAYLVGARLDGAYLGKHKINGSVGVIAAGEPNGWPAWGYVTDKGAVRVQVGCRHFEIAEGRAYWDGKKNRREVLAALDYIEAVARLRGWEPRS